jgi:hypothetical protein
MVRASGVQAIPRRRLVKGSWAGLGSGYESFWRKEGFWITVDKSAMLFVTLHIGRWREFGVLLRVC